MVLILALSDEYIITSNNGGNNNTIYSLHKQRSEKSKQAVASAHYTHFCLHSDAKCVFNFVNL